MTLHNIKSHFLKEGTKKRSLCRGLVHIGEHVYARYAEEKCNWKLFWLNQIQKLKKNKINKGRTYFNVFCWCI